MSVREQIARLPGSKRVLSHKQERGAALFETALTIGISMLLVTAFLDMCIVLWRYTELVDLVSEFADEISLLNTDCTTASLEPGRRLKERLEEAGFMVAEEQLQFQIQTFGSVYALSSTIPWEVRCASCTFYPGDTTLRLRSFKFLDRCTTPMT